MRLASTRSTSRPCQRSLVATPSERSVVPGVLVAPATVVVEGHRDHTQPGRGIAVQCPFELELQKLAFIAHQLVLPVAADRGHAAERDAVQRQEPSRQNPNTSPLLALNRSG